MQSQIEIKPFCQPFCLPNNNVISKFRQKKKIDRYFKNSNYSSKVFLKTQNKNNKKEKNSSHNSIKYILTIALLLSLNHSKLENTHKIQC